MENEQPIDLIETNGQIQKKIFHYKVKSPDGSALRVSVIADSATTAKAGLLQNFPAPETFFEYFGYSDHIIQVN